MKTKNFLFGASGHGKVVVDSVLSNGLRLEAIIDDNPKADKLLNFPIIEAKEFEFKENYNFIISIGNNSIRKKITTKFELNYFNAIHSQSSVSQFAKLGIGNVIMAQAVINADAKIGNHCIINSKSVVEHDCVLEDFVHISPNASLAGNVFIGEGSQIGIGASIIQGIKVGKWATIGAGAVVIQDVPDFAVVVGNPGKIIKYNLK
jgi:acetyltransferase EpsM